MIERDQQEIDESDAPATHEAEETHAAPAAPATALALNLPRGANWLMEQAATLDAEAAKYGAASYGTAKYNVVSALKAAANSLRAAIGFALLDEQTAVEA